MFKITLSSRKLLADITLQVSWVRLSDWHILTTGVVTYTKDDRISVLYKEGSLDWILKVEDGYFKF